MTVVSGVVVLVGAVSGVGASLHEAAGPGALSSSAASSAASSAVEDAVGAEDGAPLSAAA
ncbi:hypothetical protein OG946_19680 [Streptomyces sp. NBC_01808]|uniref:hypothetical protein n=1 Tax=Streptomyces sp. NBC_01808 TaxID=2975947 RepID=UPI002DD96254|nr:hypothetical protein [Streptomyces sp. NBC_01808]WSA39385.1 hypothetical protein OG946_19680 [Streptomyces sp. NBC_01808]